MSHAKINKPDFIGIGAMRCGTTWVADMLRAHPEIFIPAHFKELHFFDRHFQKGLDWYYDNFSGKAENQIAGEFTPAYLRDEHALQRISETCPDAKLIISLRDPRARAHSHYTFLRNRKSISTSFYDALFDDRFEILKAGLFGDQLEKYLAHFELKNIHIIIFDDIRSKPERVLFDLFRFLGVDPGFVPDGMSEKANAKHGVKFKFLARGIQQLKHFLRSSIKGRQGLVKVGFFKLGRIINKLNSVEVSKDPIDEKAKNYLDEYYQADLDKLNTLLSGRVAHWLNSQEGSVS